MMDVVLVVHVTAMRLLVREPDLFDIIQHKKKKNFEYSSVLNVVEHRSDFELTTDTP